MNTLVTVIIQTARVVLILDQRWKTVLLKIALGGYKELLHLKMSFVQQLTVLKEINKC